MTQLLPELQMALTEGTCTEQMIDHPLVRGIFYTPAMNENYNKMFEYKIRAKNEALTKEEWEHYVFLHERPYRLWAFQQLIPKLVNREYWSVMRRVWEDSENIWQNLPTWKKLLKSNRPDKSEFMTAKELAFFKTLPKEVVLYRGYKSGKNRNGLSYTLDKGKAQWFANRFNRNGKVKELTLPKNKLFAYLNSRSESEIIIMP